MARNLGEAAPDFKANWKTEGKCEAHLRPGKTNEVAGEPAIVVKTPMPTQPDQFPSIEMALRLIRFRRETIKLLEEFIETSPFKGKVVSLWDRKKQNSAT